jgi:threonine dehydrogenase-like Zn-dependent dehydrogenase
VARHLGADHTVNVEAEDLRERVQEITAGRGVDVAIDVATGGPATVLPALELLRPRGVFVVVPTQGPIPSFPIGLVQRKGLTVKGGMGHSLRSVDMALHVMASGKYPVHEVTSHRFALDEVDAAIRSTAGQGAPDTVHVSVDPWALEQKTGPDRTVAAGDEQAVPAAGR